MHYLLDTNILIAVSKKRAGLAERLQGYPLDAILLSSVVLAELEYGIAKSVNRERNRLVYDLLVRDLRVVAFNSEAARHYGQIRASLERVGQLIGPYDLLIAAQARALGAVLVTDNVREFSRVEGIEVENWLA